MVGPLTTTFQYEVDLVKLPGRNLKRNVWSWHMADAPRRCNETVSYLGLPDAPEAFLGAARGDRV